MKSLFFLFLLFSLFSSCKKAELVPDFEDYCGTWVDLKTKEQYVITKKTVVYQSTTKNERYRITSAKYQYTTPQSYYLDLRYKQTFPVIHNLSGHFLKLSNDKMTLQSSLIYDSYQTLVKKQ